MVVITFLPTSILTIVTPTLIPTIMSVPIISAFNFNAAQTIQYFIVPSSIVPNSNVFIEVYGAQGGGANTGGLGGIVLASFPVNVGQVFTIDIGQQGSTSNALLPSVPAPKTHGGGGLGFLGGAGGGATTVTTKGGSVKLIAGGGGGGSAFGGAGGSGGGTTGNPGSYYTAQSGCDNIQYCVNGAGGGQQSIGGTGIGSSLPGIFNTGGNAVSNGGEIPITSSAIDSTKPKFPTLPN